MYELHEACSLTVLHTTDLGIVLGAHCTTDLVTATPQ